MRPMWRYERNVNRNSVSGVLQCYNWLGWHELQKWCNNRLILHLSVTRMRSFGGVTFGRRETAPPGEVAIFSSFFWCAFRLDLKDTLKSLISSPVISIPSAVLHLSKDSFMIVPDEFSSFNIFLQPHLHDCQGQTKHGLTKKVRVKWQRLDQKQEWPKTKWKVGSSNLK